MTESKAFHGPRYTVQHTGRTIGIFRTLTPLSYEQRRRVAAEYAADYRLPACDFAVVPDEEYSRTLRKSAANNWPCE